MPSLRVVVSAAFLLLAAPSSGRAAPRDYDFSRLLEKAPAPTWVQASEVDMTAPTDDAEARWGISCLLDDVRLRLVTGNAERYVRRVSKAVSPAGVGELAELTVEVEPEYEALVLHAIRVIRDGRTIDALPSVSVRFMQRESELERRIYLGTVTAFIVLGDVRVGDIVDVSYSLRGQNPVLGGRYAGGLSLGASAPTRELKRQVIDSRTKHVAWLGLGDAPAPKVAEGPTFTLDWKVRDVVPATSEDRTPGWYWERPWVQLSDFSTWKDVATWGVDLYSKPGEVSPELRATAQRFSSASPSREAQLLKAVRFVQDEVRYLSISLGVHSHTPHHAARVLEQRFGDCKDKALLLVTLLREMGAEADVAFVDSDLAGAVSELLPSPLAFDHAIVRARLDGRTFWIDATDAEEGGTLLTQVPAHFGAALVVSKETENLAEMPRSEPTGPQIEVENEYSVNGDGSATLAVKTTYREEEANDMRAHLAVTPRSKLARDYLEYYAPTFPKVGAIELPEARDDRESNVLVVTERYSIPDYWDENEREVVPLAVRGYLRSPRVRLRKTPLSLQHPAWVVEQSKVHLPWKPEFEGTDHRVESKAFSYRHRERADGNDAIVRDEYRSSADAVPVTELDDHYKRLEDTRWVLVLTDQGGEGESESGPPREYDKTNAWLMLGFVGVVCAATGGFALRRAIRRRAFKRKRDGGAGDTPERPLEDHNLTSALAAVSDRRCACGRRHAVEEADVTVTEVRFGGEVLHALRFDCAHCGESRRVDFALLVSPHGAEERRSA